MDSKIYSFIGLATKAGKVASGDETCEKALKSGKAYLIIVAENASDNTKKKFSDMCSYRSIPLKVFGEKELLGRYTGKHIRSVISIMESGFAKRLEELMDGSKNELGGEQIGKGQGL